VEKIIFNTLLLIIIFEAIQNQNEIVFGNLFVKNPNKIFLNYLNQFDHTIELLCFLNNNTFIKTILNNFQYEDISNKIKISQNENDIILNNKENNTNNNKESIPITQNIDENTSDKFNESSSLLNLDCSVSLKDNKSIINLFNKNPLIPNCPPLQYRASGNDFLNIPKNYISINKFEMGKFLNNKLKLKNNFALKNTNKFQCKNTSLIGIEDLKIKENLSFISEKSETNSQKLDFLDVNMNLNSNTIEINQNSIFDTINLFILDYIIIEKIITNFQLKNKLKNNDFISNEKIEKFYVKFINFFVLKNNSNFGHGQFKFNPKSFENHSEESTNLIKINDIEAITKILFKNYLIYNLKFSLKNEDLIEKFKFYCIDYVLENHYVLDKVFEETLYYKLEIIKKKIDNKLIFLKYLIEIILFFVNIFEVEVEYEMENIKKQNIQKDLSINFNLIFHNFLNRLILEKLKNQTFQTSLIKQNNKNFDNKFFFNETNEGFVEKILFILNVLNFRISKQIDYIGYNLEKIKLQNVAKIYQMIYLYLFDSISQVYEDLFFNKENAELFDLLNSNFSNIKQSLYIYFQSFFNVSQNEFLKDGKDIRSLIKHLKNNFGDYIFYEKFEERITYIFHIIIEQNYENNHINNNKYKTNMNDKLINIAKSLDYSMRFSDNNNKKENFNNNVIDFDVNNRKKNIYENLPLDYNQRNIINLIKKNSNII